MLSYEQALAKLLGWIDQRVSVTVMPAFDGAMQVAGMAGLLRRGSPLDEEVAEAAGQTDEVLFFFVGEDEDWERRWFVLTKAHFDRAFIYPGAISAEMLVISQQGVNIAVSPLDGAVEPE